MNENKLKVLYISSWYPNRVKPLLGIFIKRHAAALAKKCSVSALYVCSDTEEGIEETTEDGIYTIRVYYKKIEGKDSFFTKWKKYKAWGYAWKKAINIYKEKQGRPDIISCNIVFLTAMIAIKLKSEWKVPFIITENWTGYFPEDGRYKGAYLKDLTKRAVNRAGAVVTDSKALTKRMQELGLKNNYYPIPNIVDTQLFNV